MNRSLIRILLWALLLTTGFLAGVAWKNAEQQTPAQESETDQPQKVAIKENVPPAEEPAATRTAAFPGADRLNPDELATIDLFERSAPSVCYITTTAVRQDFWTRNITEIPSGTGSGFVWDKNGHIVTNYHVIQGANRAQVTLSDQSTWDAVLVGKAPDKDLAVLRIEAPREKLRPIPVGASENLRVGQSVFAIGNPFGLDQTLTTGIVSALGREIQSVSGIPIRDVIQTDAAINPGNSGGPLLNSSGELIGVNTAIYSPSGASAGIGFSIPVNVVRWVIPELIRDGRITRPSLGVEVTQTSVIKRYQLDGPVIMRIEPGSAAEKAGLQPTTRDRDGNIRLGDIIFAMNDQRITSYEDLVLELEKYKPGQTISITILRNEEKMTTSLTLDQSR